MLCIKEKHLETVFTLQNEITFFHGKTPQKWPNGSAYESGRKKVLGSIPDHVCRTSRLEFSMAFSETRVNTGYYPVVRSPRRTLHPQAQVSHVP